MNIIAFETSGRFGSVAALYGETPEARLIRQIVLGGDQRTAHALAPELRRLLADIEWQPKSVALVAVAVGPGSFTGLRIGVTTAKTFAYAVGAQAIGVNTMVALASQAPHGDAPLWTIFDAQRRELFAARFDPDAGPLHSTRCDISIISQDAWLAGLQPGDRVIGPPLRQLASRLPVGVNVAPEELWQPMAAAVGRVAWQAYQSGQRDDVWKLAPHYYRPSYAEEKLAKKS
jgi:tRNA threonylcarbamoyladenosine biosynthesis protein TsaB